MICPAMLSAGLMNWTEAELITDAVLGAHQLGIGAVRDLEASSVRDAPNDMYILRAMWFAMFALYERCGSFDVVS